MPIQRASLSISTRIWNKIARIPQRVTPFHIGVTAISLLATPAFIKECRTDKQETQVIQSSAPYCSTPSSAADLAKAKSVFSPRNEIHRVFELESPLYCPQDVVRAYQVLGDFYKEVKTELANEQAKQEKDLTPERKLEILYDLMMKRFRVRTPEVDLFTTSMITGQVDCDSSALIAYAIAQELNWPVEFIFVESRDDSTPNHAFIRYNDGKDVINVEVKVDMPGPLFMRGKNYLPFNYQWGGIKYVLDKTGIEAMVYRHVGIALTELPGRWSNRYQQAEQAYTASILLFPKLSANYFSRGLVRLELKKFHEARIDFEKTRELTYKHEAAKTQLERLKAKGY